MMESEQQLEVRHEYLMTVRAHALTAVAQTLTSSECQFKIIYLTLNSIMAVGHLLWDYIDHDKHREQCSVTYTFMRPQMAKFSELGAWMDLHARMCLSSSPTIPPIILETIMMLY